MDVFKLFLNRGKLVFVDVKAECIDRLSWRLKLSLSLREVLSSIPGPVKSNSCQWLTIAATFLRCASAMPRR